MREVHFVPVNEISSCHCMTFTCLISQHDLKNEQSKRKASFLWDDQVSNVESVFIYVLGCGVVLTLFVIVGCCEGVVNVIVQVFAGLVEREIILTLTCV